jgi:hypothetical protein
VHDPPIRKRTALQCLSVAPLRRAGTASNIFGDSPRCDTPRTDAVLLFPATGLKIAQIDGDTDGEITRDVGPYLPWYRYQVSEDRPSRILRNVTPADRAAASSERCSSVP